MTTLDVRPLALDDNAADLLFRDARTANSFSDEPVTDEQLQSIYDLTKFGPTLMNAQPLRVVAVRSGDAKNRLLPHMAEGNRAKTGSAPVTLVLGYDVDFHEQLDKTFPHVPGAKDRFPDEGVRHGIGRDNAFLQIGYLILAIRAAGLAAGPMGGFDREGVDTEFFPDGRTKSVLVVNVGNPGDNPWLDRLPRLTYDDVVTEV
ncbi:MAG: 3-hydroxypropanoate dehydrogenase [Frankiales bacterium]|jgi:nitroreductase|nr:3-hydroxypropanoate dehydrogenase [Frankiales bacterium]